MRVVRVAGLLALTLALAGLPRGGAARLGGGGGLARRAPTVAPRAAVRAARREPAAAADAATDETLRRKRRYINFTGFPFPLGPLFSRETRVRELHRGRVWLFEQEQSLGVGRGSTISTNARMVVVRLADGGLWVLNPLAPTAELVEQLRALGGRVGHVVLGSTQYEHKVFVPAFMRAVRADGPQLWVVPEQWAFPLDLPLELLGIFGARTLRDGLPEARQPVWASELRYALLRPRQRLGLGYAAVEAAFVHTASRTLLLTDALVQVPRQPPPVLDRANLRALGEPGNLITAAAAWTNWRGQRQQIRAAEEADAAAGQTEEQAVQRGWKRNAVLSLFFGPSAEAISRPERAFDALAGRWLVGPVCATLIYSSPKVSVALALWVDKIASGRLGRFDTIVPAHLGVGRGTPADVRRAFAPVLSGCGTDVYRAPDVRLLADISSGLRKLGVI